MATSSGNSSGNSMGSGDRHDNHNGLMISDERKRKRMESNRESARRSRMRKQKHIEDLTSQVTQLKKENEKIISNINMVTNNYVNVEAENSILRAQMMELRQSLLSLNNILSYINNNNNNVVVTNNFTNDFHNHHHEQQIMQEEPWNLMYLNQPIMASADHMFNYDQY